ncbi:hypothetical protein KXD93_04255 [Mucilaginibacter sp. BJC16-A38]|uniref:hypothetical protein n=1 Tax=Mucilaginibacter phenanthrenivorans TaxID=1234842 RepID=UPI002157B204|nr:hypothetical protein [Mucilaginibacter phenanthrenivorans]MCR8556836.1 hypothetical protein [Mucilaginibacter phenanthrenivorans]
MKKPYLLVLFFVLLCFSSCVDIEEQYNFKQDGSCNVVYGFDMGSAVSVLMNLMSDSVKATPQFSLVKDTTLNFYTALPDSTQQKMSVAEANMARSSDLSIKMNLRKNIMKVSVNHLAKNSADLEYYLKHISKIPVNSQLKAVAKGQKPPLGIDAQQLVAGEDYYTYEITPHKFYRIIDKVKFNAFLKKTSSAFSMAKAMLIDMPYKVVLNFARPVKRVNNAKAIVSADRRRVTLITNMDDVMKNPSLMNLKIDF